MVKVNNICFSYKNHTILNDVSFSVKEGTCVGIIGSNGCGKSTLLSIMAGSRKQKSGTIEYPEGSKVGYVPQDNPLLPDLSGYDNLLLWYKGTAKELKEELKTDLITMLGINNFLKKPVKSLSGGMKKRLSLAIALINKPTFLIMDEPSAALDLPCKQDMIGYLKEYLKTGGSVLITTHEEEEMDICSELYVIKKGEIINIDKNLRGSDLTAVL